MCGTSSWKAPRSTWMVLASKGSIVRWHKSDRIEQLLLVYRLDGDEYVLKVLARPLLIDREHPIHRNSRSWRFNCSPISRQQWVAVGDCL